MTQNNAVFVSPSPFTPIPISARLSSSFDNNTLRCLNISFLHLGFSISTGESTIISLIQFLVLSTGRSYPNGVIELYACNALYLGFAILITLFA